MSDIRIDYCLSGAGNTFIVADQRGLSEAPDTEAIRTQCARFKTDGLLWLAESNISDIRMRIFNRDGSEAEMCGNGARCAAFWAHKRANVGSDMTIETIAGSLNAFVLNDSVRIRLTDPQGLTNNLNFEIDGVNKKAFFINTGVPHVVLHCESLDQFDVETHGRKIRRDKRFEPDGTNASFFSVNNQHEIRVRTYERGVENETQACGTGCTASAIIASLIGRCEPPIDAITASSEMLRIDFRREHSVFRDVYLEGFVKIIKEGTTTC